MTFIFYWVSQWNLFDFDRFHENRVRNAMNPQAEWMRIPEAEISSFPKGLHGFRVNRVPIQEIFFLANAQNICFINVLARFWRGAFFWPGSLHIPCGPSSFKCYMRTRQGSSLTTLPLQSKGEALLMLYASQREHKPLQRERKPFAKERTSLRKS